MTKEEKQRSTIAMKRTHPNILITGTPGTGKSALSDYLSQHYYLPPPLDISQIVKQKQWGEYNQHWNTIEIDEEKVLDYLEDILAKGNQIVNYHANELFPQRWFDLVIVLTTNNTILYDRLKKR